MTKKEFILLLLVTAVAVVFWIGADIYHAKSQVKISSQLEQALQPIDPTLDTSILSKIGTPPPSPSPTLAPTPQPVSSASASPSARLLPVPTASASALPVIIQ